MKYVFSAQFLKVRPPETSFADAWEALCADLLRYELQNEECICMKAPDRGIDIFLRNNKKAIQCKSDERGAFGVIQPAASIGSLSTAVNHKKSLGWHYYVFATNANYSGNGVEQILVAAEELGIDRETISFHGPDHWSELCEKHIEKVKDRLDYRLIFSEDEVIDAFRKARYYEHKVNEYSDLISQGAYSIELSNNRTPLLLQIPFSPELTIKNCLNIATQLLNINLDSEDYHDLETSAQPSISITIDKVPQDFSKKLGEYSKEELSKLQLWIKIIWKDMRKQASDKSQDMYLYRTTLSYKHDHSQALSEAERSKQTLSRFEMSLQNRMWSAASS